MAVKFFGCFFFEDGWEGGANGDSWKANEAAEVGLWLVVTLPITRRCLSGDSACAFREIPTVVTQFPSIE